MRRKAAIFTVIFVFSAFQQAFCFWIWTPKTGKWVNPKSEAKTNPKEQFDFAKGFYDEKKYPEAEREFKRLLKDFPKSFEASESQYYLGLIEEARGSLYEAFKSYQKVIDKYPFSERTQEIIEREYKIGEMFMSEDKRRGVPIIVEHPSIEVFSQVIENSTYGPLAPKAQYKLGLVLKSLMRYYEAEEAFNKVITNYPDSEWVEAAKFQIASCRASLSRGADYDQAATKEAKKKFEEFIREHPDAVLSRDAEKNISQLTEKEAEANYNTGRFYEKQKQFDAARVYYNEAVAKYSDTVWAAKSLERLRIMEKMK
ncbi:MAG: outer membrane protein assembly factor BamD [Candidatus Omnitrophota bacterium]